MYNYQKWTAGKSSSKLSFKCVIYSFVIADSSNTKMAVKHKVVDCVDQKGADRLSMLLRILENINSENGMQGREGALYCERIVASLGTLVIPQDMEDYMKFMKDIETIQGLLANMCSSNEERIFTTLKAFYNDISNPNKQVQPTVCIVLQLIKSTFIPTAVKWILHSGYSEQNHEQALTTLCNFLTRWTVTPNLGTLVYYFMEGLEAEQHYDILVEVTLRHIEQLFRLLILPDQRRNVGRVVEYMLIKNQQSPEAFHKIIPYVGTVLTSLSKENSASSQQYLQMIVNLCVALMEHFPGFPRYYDSLKRSLEPFNHWRNYTLSLNCKSWSDDAEVLSSAFINKGKVGLNNLGNTCYMNSVLQALFMTKVFRNELLLSGKDAVPLLSKLQVLFALLQHSKRPALSPADILTLARPPGFQPGHQHDSSEFLGYLLDVLHEQERTIYQGEQATASAAGKVWFLCLLFVLR